MATVNRRDFLRRTACAAAGGWLLGADRTDARAAASDAKRPNVILIMADDLGYETLGANGGTSYKTPVLDKLAAEGARFEYCFAQPLCTPTRLQLMTGIYNVRNYTHFGHMDPSCTTFAHLFKRAGYATCIAGKWQLGQDVDLPKTFGRRPSAPMGAAEDAALEAVRQAGLAIELNTSGLRSSAGEAYPAPSLLARAARMGIPLTFGSDAHAAADVGRDFGRAVVLARAAGYTTTLRLSDRVAEALA